MGSGQSSISDLQNNEFLIKFSKETPINYTDNEFWDQLLAFKFDTPFERYICGKEFLIFFGSFSLTLIIRE